MYSANKIDKAGKRLKARARGEAVDDGAYDEAWKILVWFRKEHQLRMVKAARKLRSILKKTHPEWAPPVQRLKRTPSIAAKLARSNGPRLSTMCDIGGCRAVVPNLADVRWLESECGKVFEVARTDDRSVHGDVTGYRALHLHVTIDGHEIEIQIRTKLQQEWAETVERWDAHLGCDLKHDEGPEEIKVFLRNLSELYSYVDTGEAVGSDFVAGFEQSRTSAQEFEKGVGSK